MVFFLPLGLLTYRQGMEKDDTDGCGSPRNRCSVLRTIFFCFGPHDLGLGCFRCSLFCLDWILLSLLSKVSQKWTRIKNRPSKKIILQFIERIAAFVLGNNRAPSYHISHYKLSPPITLVSSGGCILISLIPTLNACKPRC
jgi:hypothetical protein